MKIDDDLTALYIAKEIQDLLLTIGTPANLKGFKYITYAVQLILKDPDTATIKIVEDCMWKWQRDTRQPLPAWKEEFVMPSE